MTKQDEVQQRVRTIEALVGKLDEAADPALRSAAKDLVQALMELHGAGIERMLEIAHETGDAGCAIIDRFGRDELVRSVLLLYGLHPQDLASRVAQALEGLRGFLKTNSASAELISLDEAGVVTVRFAGKTSGCGSSASSVKSRIEATLQEAAPDAASIIVEDNTPSPLTRSTFVSIAELQTGQALSAISAPHVQRSGD